MFRMAARRWLLLAVILLALGLRLFRIDAQSLWYDEGTSVALAGRNLATITRSAAADIHPPFYYYALHGWTALAGFSPSAVRALSALVGTALVGITWALAQQLYGPSTALVAAFLAAISPFAVYYSQETRMYILVATLGALSTWLAGDLILTTSWRAEHDAAANAAAQVHPWMGSRRRVWVAYVVTSALVLYTHYFGFTVLLAQSVAVAVWWLIAARRRMAFVIRWAAAQLAVGVLYLPWLLLTWRQLQGWPAVSEPFSLTFLVRETLRVFSLGLSVEPQTTTWAVWAFAALVAVGIAAAVAERRAASAPASAASAPRDAWRWLMPLLYLGVPVATMYVLSLRRPLYNPKFLLPALPAFHVLLAVGVTAVAGWVSSAVSRMSRPEPEASLAQAMAPSARALVVGAFLAGLLVPTAQSLHNYYYHPRFARDDYRGIARFVAATSEPNDAVLLNAPSQIEVFDYYFNAQLAEYPLPQQRPPDAAAVRDALADIIDQHDRIFGVFWATDESDPEGVVESWLNEHAYKALDDWYGNVRLVVYATPSVAEQAVVERVGSRLGDNIRLEQALLEGRSVAAGDILTLALRWQALAPVEQRYKVFVQLLSPDNQLMAQRDAEPQAGQQPTDAWQPGSTVVDRYGLWIPPGTPPAAYRLIVGMYDPQSGQRLTVTQDAGPDGDWVDLGTVRVVAPASPPPVDALRLEATANRDYGALTLLGYSVDKRGAEGQPRAPLYPGDTARITLFWRAKSEPPGDPHLTLQLMAGDSVRAAADVTPTNGLYPAPQWAPQQVVRDPHDLPLPADLAPGRYRLQLGVAGADGQSLGPPLTLPLLIAPRPQ